MIIEFYRIHFYHNPTLFYFQLNRTKVVGQQKNKHRFDPIKLNRGVVLVSNLPHGFFEPQLEKYFNQFGRVTRLRLARSQQTGQSKGHAFVEFQYPEVAQVAAETLNNYLMYRHILKTVYIPPAKQTHNYFRQDVTFQETREGTKVYSEAIKRLEATIKNRLAPVTKQQLEIRNKRSQKL